MNTKPFLRDKALAEALLADTSLALRAVREFIIRPTTSLGDTSEEQAASFKVSDVLYKLNLKLDEVRQDFAQLNIQSYEI